MRSEPPVQIQPLESDSLCLSVAGLGLSLDARATGIQMSLPVCHSMFRQAGPTGGDLALQVRKGPVHRVSAWQAVYSQAETWELWRDAANRLMFLASPHSPPRRQVAVDAGFRAGELLGEFTGDSRPLRVGYPLSDLDVKIYANWLGESGDLILHAAGVAIGGRGYCFAGESGTGKSTLATAFAGVEGATVLGEDNVVLRWVDARFWIFGTPWHLNLARCSPMGVPLESLFFLDRAAPEGAHVCRPDDGVSKLLQTGFVPYYRADLVERILERLALLARCVPFLTLGYRLGADVMDLV